MKTKQTINISLTRDPRYLAAKERYDTLKAELDSLDKQVHAALSGMSNLPSATRNQIADEAEALLSGRIPPDPVSKQREALIKTTDELSHRREVVREAVRLQRVIVAELQAEVSHAIASDLLPQHKANVSAVIEALLTLNAALEAEDELRQSLDDNGVLYHGVIRPMPLGGFRTLRDADGRISRYLKDAYESGFIAAKDLPDVVHDRIPKPQPKAKPEPVHRDNDGWLMA